MEWAVEVKKQLSFSWLEAGATLLGKDVVICVKGGERPHVGCTIMAVPRPSLKGDGAISSTSSVLNLTGHKDEALLRTMAEELCREINGVVVCAGGFHVDCLKEQQLMEVLRAAKEITAELKEGLRAERIKK